MTKIKAIITSFTLALILFLGFQITPALATGVYDLPIVNAGDDVWVYDNSDTLSRATENQLSGNLKKLANQTGNEVRVVVMNRLDYGYTMESFTEELFKKWYPTPEEQDNQVLFVLDTLTNRSAIVAGEKASNLLTNDISNSVITETLVEPLRNLQYNQALFDASDRMVAVLSGLEDPGPPQIKELNIEGTFTTAEETDDRSATIWTIVLLILATVIPMVTYFWYVGFPGN
jgi:uncharacterized protein